MSTSPSVLAQQLACVAAFLAFACGATKGAESHTIGARPPMARTRFSVGAPVQVLDTQRQPTAGHERLEAPRDKVSRGPDESNADAQTDEGNRWLLEEAMASVARLRGWPDLSGLRVEEPTPVELRGWLDAELNARVPAAVAAAHDRSLGLLGVLPENFDSNSALLDVLAMRLQGAYLTTRRSIALRRHPRSDVRSTMIHEVVHAYQDRLYGLGSRLAYRTGAGDSIAALHAFAEGEASHVEMELMQGDFAPNDGVRTDAEFDRELAGSLSRVELPDVLKRSVSATYVDGFRFVSHLRRVGGWKLVDAVWRRGLASTAELLHPDRWIDGRGELGSMQMAVGSVPPPTEVASQDGTLAHEDTMGEQTLRILLEKHPRTSSTGLAANWDGDRLWLTSNALEDRVVWRITTSDAGRVPALEQGLRRVLLGRPESAQRCRAMPHATVAVSARGHDIFVVAARRRATGAGKGTTAPCATLTAVGAPPPVLPRR